MSRPTIVAASCLLLIAACSNANASRGDEFTQAELEELTARIQLDVERLRGTRFEAPVQVALASTEEFRDYVMARLEAMETPERLRADEEVAKLLGVLAPEYDFLGGLIALVESQVGGFYDPMTKRFYLMREFDGDLARIILAHELAHALDDQLYGIDEGLLARKDNSDGMWAFQAVVEGSGTEVMSRWTVENMASLDRSALMKASTMGMDELRDAPSYLWKPLIGAYSQGQGFLSAGPDGMSLDALTARAFTDPPRSSEQVLHPEKYWDADERDDPVEVAVAPVELPDGWELRDEDTLGELGLALVVEPVDRRGGVDNALALMSARLTWKASKGWGGDRYVLLGRGAEDSLLYLATTWDREADAVEFAEALEDVRAHVVAGYAEKLAVERDGRHVHVMISRGAGADLAKRAASWATFGG